MLIILSVNAVVTVKCSGFEHKHIGGRFIARKNTVVRISEGNTISKPKSPQKSEDSIDENGIPYGQEELPKTDGIPLERIGVFGISVVGTRINKKE